MLRIDDGAIITALNKAWAAAHPQATAALVAFSVNDDGMLIWLHDRSTQATTFAKKFLPNYGGTSNNIEGNPKPYRSSGLVKVYAGSDAAGYFHVRPGDPRVPDLLGITKVGVVYTGGEGKIVEHGGANRQDRNVPLVESGSPVGHRDTRTGQVETTQIAPTVLSLLGLIPGYLQAVQIEHTATCPSAERAAQAKRPAHPPTRGGRWVGCH